MPRPNTSSAHALSERDLRPTTKLALRMYATGAVKTISDAARATGTSIGGLYIAKTTKTGRDLIESVDQQTETRAVDVSKLIASLSITAVDKLAELMVKGGNDKIQFMAAKDLLDRNPLTSKTQKIQVEGFSLGEEDAKVLAAALVESHGVRERLGDAGKRDLLAIAGGSVELPDAPEVKLQGGAAQPVNINREGL